MNRHNLPKRAAVLLFFLTIALFSAFFLYMGSSEKVSVYQAEQPHNYRIITDLQMELTPDDTAPIGLRKIYSWVLNSEHLQDSCLCFNISHHHIQVYFDDELVYSLTGAENNLIGKNVSSNWCAVPVEQFHNGSVVTVVLTPLFEAALSKTPHFLLGSHYAIALDLLTSELPLLVLSSLCILLGIFVAAVFLYLHYATRAETNGVFYLGLFSIFMGVWKITDLRSMPLLIPESSMALGYISVGSLFLTALCLMLYFSTLFVEKKQGVILLFTILGSVVCLSVLAMQLLGIAEIRQNLFLSHVLLIAAVASIPLTALFNRLVHKNSGLRRSWKLLLLLFLGIALDFLLYYRNNGNGALSFSIMGFIIYSLTTFFVSLQHSTQKAYTDTLTGLANRARWAELMNSSRSLPEPYAMLVIDLNGLKQVNDTLGHEAGDQMIFQFSNILRIPLPRTSVICRWGGDEFAVLLTNVNRNQLNFYMDALLDANHAYNAEHPELPIHFAMGASLSSEHPGVSRSEMFRLADEEMYRNKQEYHFHR